jgi:hypothetical protein
LVYVLITHLFFLSSIYLSIFFYQSVYLPIGPSALLILLPLSILTLLQKWYIYLSHTSLFLSTVPVYLYLLICLSAYLSVCVPNYPASVFTDSNTN